MITTDTRDRTYCREHCKGFRDTGGLCFADGECEAYTQHHRQSAGALQALRRGTAGAPQMSKPVAEQRRKGDNQNTKRMSLFKDKTRMQHFGIGFVLGLLFTIITVAVAAYAGEYKDRAHGGAFDWGDLACTILGGLAGQAVQAAVVLAIIFG